MKKDIVYFKSENDAEAARSDLEKLKVRNIRVEKISEDFLNKHAFSPLFSGFTGPGLEMAPLKEEETLKGKRKSVTHLLRFEVPEEKYKEAMSILKSREGYSKKAK